MTLRDRYNNREISLHGLWTATKRLEAKLDQVLAHPGRDELNRRFSKHLLHERPHLFAFLYCPRLDATSNVSERAIRALIGARKKLRWQPHRTKSLRSGHTHQHFANRPTAEQKAVSMFLCNYCVLVIEDRILDLVPLTPWALLGSSLHPPAFLRSFRHRGDRAFGGSCRRPGLSQAAESTRSHSVFAIADSYSACSRSCSFLIAPLFNGGES